MANRRRILSQDQDCERALLKMVMMIVIRRTGRKRGGRGSGLCCLDVTGGASLSDSTLDGILVSREQYEVDVEELGLDPQERHNIAYIQN